MATAKGRVVCLFAMSIVLLWSQRWLRRRRFSAVGFGSSPQPWLFRRVQLERLYTWYLVSEFQCVFQWSFSLQPYLPGRGFLFWNHLCRWTRLRYPTYHALYTTALLIQTNFMRNILCMLNHILIITPTRFGIHWCHLQGLQSYCSSFWTHQNCDIIQAALQWLIALIRLLYGRNSKLSDARWWTAANRTSSAT